MKILKLFVLSLSLLALFSSCTSGPKKLRVGLSLPTQREERWVNDRIRMMEVAKALDIDLRVQVSDNDGTRQVSQCENLLAQGIEVLILAPHDAKSAATIVEMAHARKVKVISYDRLIMDADVDVYITFDNVRVGELQGEYITRMVPKGNYVVLAGAPTDNNARLFKQGAMKYIKPLVDRGDIRIVMEQDVKDWQPIEAMKIMENALILSKNDIQAVLAPNDGTAGGVIQALAAQKLDGKVIVTGQDAEVPAARRILDGSQAMTIFKDTRLLGKAAIETALALVSNRTVATNATVNNGKIDVPSILFSPVVVDKANLMPLLVESGYIKSNQVLNLKTEK